MGKSRSRSAKGANVFRIARSGAVKAKAKGKARPVTSGLKQVSGAGGGGATTTACRGVGAVAAHRRASVPPRRP